MSNGDSRVYVLGAGASREATKNLQPPMPLVDEFFLPEYISKFWSENLYSNDFAKHLDPPFNESVLFHLLESYFDYKIGTDSSLKEKNKVNIEELFSLVESISIINSGEEFYARRLSAAKQELLMYIFKVMRYLPWSHKVIPLYSFISKNLRKTDSIVTFNWDLLMDEQLEQVEEGRNILERQMQLFNLDSFSKVMPGISVPRNDGSVYFTGYDSKVYDDYSQSWYLKLHGSINYLKCENKDCRRFHWPLRASTFFEPHRPLPCPECSSRLQIFIMPPYVHKTYALNNFTKRQAYLTKNVLRRADELVIIGYSFPDFDFEAKSLFKMLRLERSHSKVTPKAKLSSRLEKIILVNPLVKDEQFKAKIEGIFGLKNTELNYGKEICLELYESADEFLLSR